MSKYLCSELLSYPFDQYQRYRLVAEILDRLRESGERFMILEVGGFHGLARKFLDQDDVVIVDLFCNGENLDIISDAENLPFPDRAFPVVISTDFLEHIKPQDRSIAIQEMARVSSELVLLAAPFQYQLARSAEKLVFDFIKDWLGYEHKYLKEHLEREAPDLIETESELIKAGFDTIIFPNCYLERWLLMMLIYYYFEGLPSGMKIRQEISRFYNQHYFWKDIAEPAYRHLILASRKIVREKPEAFKDLIEKRHTEPEPSFEKLKLWAELFRAGEVKRLLGRISELENLLNEKENELNHLKSYISELEDFQSKTKNSLAYRIYEKFFKRG